ncbi:hypothetical protein ABE527_08440 [Brucella sp. TWI432]
MKRASLLATALLLCSSAAFGGDQNQTLEEFSSDLVELYSLSGITKNQLADMNPKAQVYAVHRLMKQANQFQAKWRDSDLVEIDRFHVSGGDQLALDIEFRFK